MFFSLAMLLIASNFSNGQLPTLNSTSSDFRSITIVVNDVLSWNASGTATQHNFDFDSKPGALPSYLVGKSKLVIGPSSSFTASGLLLNQVVSVKFGLRTTSDSPVFTEWRNYTTKDPKEAGAVLLPGKVLNLTAMANPDKQSHRSVIITFDSPTNVQNSVNANDKSIQYRIEECKTRYLTKSPYDCKIITELLSNPQMAAQSTEDLKKSTLYDSNMHPPQNKVVTFRVTAISLNGTEGPSETVVARLDPSTEPDPPMIGSKNVGSVQFTLTVQMRGCNTIYPCSFLYKYNVKGSEAVALLPIPITTTQNSREVLMNDHLRPGTEYEISVMLTDCINGTSKWSAKHPVKTKNEPAIVGDQDIKSNQLSLRILFSDCPCQYTLQNNIKGSSEIINSTFGIAGNSTYRLVTGLNANTEYEFRVAVLDSTNGPTGWSDTYTVKTAMGSNGNILVPSLFAVLVAMVLKMFLDF